MGQSLNIVSLKVFNDNRPFVTIKVKKKEMITLFNSEVNCSVLYPGYEEVVSELGLRISVQASGLILADNTKHTVKHFICLHIDFLTENPHELYESENKVLSSIVANFQISLNPISKINIRVIPNSMHYIILI